VDRIADDINTDNYSDFSDSPGSTNSDIDVKEALRSTINEKCKQNPNSVIMHVPSIDYMEENSMGVEGFDTGSRKNRKPKLEDEESVAIRRERNRIAAQRCRQRRRDRIDKLEKICERLEGDGDKLQCEIGTLQKEMNDLQRILTNHKCMAKPIKTEIFMPNVK